MKDKQKTKPTKKKILTYYLILAACLLVIAAIAVGVIFGVQPRNNPVIDSGGQPEQPAPDDGDKPDDNPPPVIDTSSKYEFIAPVKAVTVSQTHFFWHNASIGEYRQHQGMDFACAAGTEVLAAVDGTVKNVFTGHMLYGSWIEIEHENDIKTVYMYVTPTAGLKAGDKVNRGDVIGTVMAATGQEVEAGDHLHFEVYKNNIMQDPDDYLKLITK